MKKIEISEEDYNFLKELQHELKTQDTDGNADPVFWGVMEKKRVFVPEGCGEPIINDAADCALLTLEDAIEMVEDAIEFDKREDWKEDWDEVDKTNIYDVLDFIQNTMGWEGFDMIYYDMVDYLSRDTGAFLTKKACKEYIENHDYNHNEPRTYAMTAFRNKEYGRLIDIVKSIDFKKLD